MSNLVIGLALSFNLNAQNNFRDVFLNDAQVFMNNEQYELAIGQLKYFNSINEDHIDSNVEYVLILAWMALGNYLEVNRHINKYFKVASKDQGTYTNVKNIQEEIEEEVFSLTKTFSEWAQNATENGKPYNWDQHSGLYPVGISPNYEWCGYINKHGEVVIPFQYRLVSHFENGIAYVHDRISGDKELIDTNGNMIHKFDAHIETVYPFQEGHAVFRESFSTITNEYTYGIINDKGKRIDNNFVSGVNIGLRPSDVLLDDQKIPILRNGYFGNISIKTGKSSPELPVQSQFPILSPFSGGYSIASTLEDKHGVVNKDYEILLPLKYNRIITTPNKNEFLILEELKHSGKVRVYNALLDKLLPMKVISTTKKALFPALGNLYPSFEEKYMPLYTKSGKVSYFDHNLDSVFDKKYAFAKRYSEDRAAVINSKGKTGYINEFGEMVIGYNYNIGQLFSQGLAGVSIGSGSSEKYGFINKQGDVLIPFEYDYVEPFFASTKIFKNYYDSTELTFNVKADPHVNPLNILFDTNEVFFHLLEGKMLALVKKRDKFQFIDSNGKVWLERLWEDIKIIEE